ncbi:uncharacterized protein DEA37_0006697 [Paragonimus westermani]|uniref:NHR domain-containing protein n=1 Tax=Paragonimus westermani TaxID=34504 RepID=A0A5J4NUY6_9TREM|nr:uncharacterized protein DEA37_0006697 [Paragonimus westermani]
MSAQRFDVENKGRYVAITEHGTMARRQLGFCDGVVLSASYIRPGELVAVEILETQPGWSGDLRIGFTLLPEQALKPLPSFALPELVSRGQSWIVPVGTTAALLVSHRHRAFWRRQQQLRRSTRRADGVVSSDVTVNGLSDVDPVILPAQLLPDSHLLHPAPVSSGSPVCFCCLHTVFGRVSLSRLMPMEAAYLRPPDVEKGSVVAIYYDLEPVAPTSTISAGFSSSSVEVDNQTVNSTESSEQLTTDRHPRPNPSHSLFCFRFHVVINGVDLITAEEQLSLKPDQLLPSPEYNLYVSLDHVPSPNSVDFLTHSSLSPIPFFPKLRAVFDVYGQTKSVQLVALNQSPVVSLSRLCSCSLLTHLFRLHCRGSARETQPDRPVKSFKYSEPTDDSINGSASVNLNPRSPRAIDSLRLRHLLAVLHALPLPRSDRYRLQLDAHAIMTRELEGLLIFD